MVNDIDEGMELRIVYMYEALQRNYATKWLLCCLQIERISAHCKKQNYFVISLFILAKV